MARLLRNIERRERISQGTKHPANLDAFNEAATSGDKGRYLHPRKGRRKFSVRRGRAAMITAEQKAGKLPPSIFALQAMKLFLTTGKWA
jgi:hypothetical protein